MSKEMQSTINGDAGWMKYEMRPVDSFSLAVENNDADFISLQVAEDNQREFVPLVNNQEETENAYDQNRLNREEKIALAEKNGVEPVEFIIARDAIAVIVNPENPIEKLTLGQISDIYSGKTNNWNELGGDDRPIVRLSRETNSGTHVYFLEEVLRLGQKENNTLFSQDTLLLPSS